MIEREDQLLLAVRTLSLGLGGIIETLSLRGVFCTTVDFRFDPSDIATIEVLAPSALDEPRAIAIGADIATRPEVLAVAIVALRRRDRPDPKGDMIARRTVATWAGPFSLGGAAA